MRDQGIDHFRYEFAGSCDHATTASAPPRRIRRPADPDLGPPPKTLGAGAGTEHVSDVAHCVPWRAT